MSGSSGAGGGAGGAGSAVAGGPVATPPAQGTRPTRTEQQKDQPKAPQTTKTLRAVGEKAVLKHGRPTLVSDIRNAVTTKYNQVFMLTAETGDILATNQGYGLYFRDTCYLEQLELRVWGDHMIPLLADDSAGDACHFELTNGDILRPDGKVLSKERISIHRRFELRHQVIHEVTMRNLSSNVTELDVTLDLTTRFTNMFVVRGTPVGKRGTLHPVAATGPGGNTLRFAYDGADKHRRTTTVVFTPAPTKLDLSPEIAPAPGVVAVRAMVDLDENPAPDGPPPGGAIARYHLQLQPRESFQITLAIALEDLAPTEQTAAPYESSTETVAKIRQTPGTTAAKHQEFDELLSALPTIVTNNPLFDLALARSLADIRALATAETDGPFLAAGVPWYVALFGRDSAIAAFQMLAFQPALARSTLGVLAKYQGRRRSDFQDEEPGKILHELRVGEKANLREVPQYPYYGSVDATPWFLILLGEYVRWTGDLDVFHTYQENAERALEWIDANPAQHDLEFVSYGTRSSKGLVNQGWKDSGNSIVNEDGSLCQPPIALVEVQGYVYAAKRALATLYRLTGNTRRADALELQAEDLKLRFNARYWMEEKQFYGLAIQRDDVLARAIASNPGQLLFTGIVDHDRAAKVSARLLQEDMSSGWGIRTLAATEVAYNPLDYQVGAIWPHDNALIALGMRRCGFERATEHVFTGIFEAVANFTHYRMPEVFDGFGRNEYSRPVLYPVACIPQAWAAGALPLLLTAAMGLEPDAPNHVLHIHHPRLPAWLTELSIHGVRVGQAKVDLRYVRNGDVTLVGVLGCVGKVTVLIEY